MPRNLTSSAHFGAAGGLAELCGLRCWVLVVPPKSASGAGISDTEERNMMRNNSKAAQSFFQDLCGRLGFRAVNVTWHVKSDMIITVKEPSFSLCMSFPSFPLPCALCNNWCLHKMGVNNFGQPWCSVCSLAPSRLFPIAGSGLGYLLPLQESLDQL